MKTLNHTSPVLRLLALASLLLTTQAAYASAGTVPQQEVEATAHAQTETRTAEAQATQAGHVSLKIARQDAPHPTQLAWDRVGRPMQGLV